MPKTLTDGFGRREVERSRWWQRAMRLDWKSHRIYAAYDGLLDGEAERLVSFLVEGDDERVITVVPVETEGHANPDSAASTLEKSLQEARRIAVNPELQRKSELAVPFLGVPPEEWPCWVFHLLLVPMFKPAEPDCYQQIPEPAVRVRFDHKAKWPDGKLVTLNRFIYDRLLAKCNADGKSLTDVLLALLESPAPRRVVGGRGAPRVRTRRRG